MPVEVQKHLFTVPEVHQMAEGFPALNVAVSELV